MSERYLFFKFWSRILEYSKSKDILDIEQSFKMCKSNQNFVISSRVSSLSVGIYRVGPAKGQSSKTFL